MINILWKFVDKTVSHIIYRVFRVNIAPEAYINLLQFVKFGIVGFLNTLISYITYLVLIKFRFHYAIANILGFTISVLNAYYWNNNYVFASKKKRSWWKALIKTYIAYSGTGIFLSNVLLFVWIDVIKISATLAPILNILFIFPINYLINKYWAFD